MSGRPLFDAKVNHGALLPVTNLMKAEDFLGKEALNQDSGGRSSGGKRPTHLGPKVNIFMDVK